MTNFTWPDTLAPESNVLEWVDATAQFRAMPTGTIRTRARNAGYWRLTMRFDNLPPAQMQELEAFLWRLDGTTHRAFIPDHAYRRQGTGAGSPVVSGAGQVGYSLVTDGWSGSDPVLLAGDRFVVDGQMCVVAEPCTPTAGAATIVLCHPLRSSPDDGEALVLDDMTIRYVLVSRVESAARLGVVKSVTCEFEEYFAPAAVVEESSTAQNIYVMNGESIEQHESALPWDLSDTSYTGRSLDVSTADVIARNFFISPSGVHLFVVAGETGYARVVQFLLATPGRIDSGVYVRTLDVLAYCQPYSISFNDDGTRMFLGSGGSPDDPYIHRFDLSSGWNIATASHISATRLQE